MGPTLWGMPEAKVRLILVDFVWRGRKPGRADQAVFMTQVRK